MFTSPFGKAHFLALYCSDLLFCSFYIFLVHLKDNNLNATFGSKMASGQPQNVATASAIVPTIPAMAPAASVNVATHLSLFEHLPDEMLLEILKIHLSQSRVLAIKARVTRSFRRVRANDDTVEVHAIKKVSFRVAPRMYTIFIFTSQQID